MDKTIKLLDGRTLGYTEHGDLGGYPVFFVHGNPGSRYMRHIDETLAKRHGVRIITPDRPGYGLSDYQEKRTLLGFPEDIRQLADALNITSFSIFGVSAGGPYVAATAYRLPERVATAAMVSSTAPFDEMPNPYEGMNSQYVQAFKAAALPELALRPLVANADKAIMKDLDAYWSAVLERAGSGDRPLLEQPEYKKQILDYWPEATRQGSDGRVREAKILVSPWGFLLEDIQPTIHLWYWEEDHIVPIEHGQYLANRIPNSVTHFLPGGGHFGVFLAWSEILETLWDTVAKGRANG